MEGGTRMTHKAKKLISSGVQMRGSKWNEIHEMRLVKW